MKMNTMKVWLMVTTWFSFTIANFGLCIDITPSFTITLKPAEDKGRYQDFLVTLRNNLATGGEISHGLQVLPGPNFKGTKYIIAKLKNTKGNEIELGFCVINAYLVAYRVINNPPTTKDNSYFFNDPEFSDAKNYIFKDTNQIPLTFSSNYQSLGDRKKVELGVIKLDSHIYTLHKETEKSKIADPLLCVIQMVSEASRFKYIENKIVDVIGGSFKPKDDVISRENNWDNLSRAIQTADQNGNIPQKYQVQLKYEDGSQFTVTNINQVIREIVLLKKYVPEINFNPSLEQTVDALLPIF